MKRLKEFISNIKFNNNNNVPDPHEIVDRNKILDDLNDLIKNGVLCYRIITHNKHEYLITWEVDKYKSDISICLYEYIGSFRRIYSEYDSDMRKNIGNTKTYYIEAAKKLFNDYQEEKAKKLKRQIMKLLN